MKTGIGLFVYNRPNHLTEVIEGLRKNNIKKLYIFSDGPKNNEDNINVEKVRKIISSIDWCDTEIVKHDVNKGLAYSVVFGVNFIFERHDRIITLADDCVPSSDYVEYMNRCFDEYESDNRVMNVSGFSLPIEIPKEYPYDIYFTYRFTNLGTWKRAWKYYEKNNELINKINDSYFIKSKVNRAGEDLVPMLKKQMQGKIDSWAIYWAIAIAINDGLNICPCKSKIRNIGFDGSGTHCDTEDRRSVVNAIDEDVKTMRLPNLVECDWEINKRISNYLIPGNLSENGRRYKSYYNMLLKWIENIQNNIDIGNYMNNKNVKNIAIYGSGEIGLKLYNEVYEKINVRYFIDKKNKSNYNGIPIISYKDLIGKSDVDMIIVTPMYDYSEIVNQISYYNSSVEVISIETLVDLVKNSYY